MIASLLVGTLAVTFAWEALRYLPWSLPSWLRPLIVLAASFGYAWPDWRLAVGIAGGVALVHALLLGRREQEPVQITRSIGGRIPPLP